MDKTLQKLCRLCGEERLSSFDVFIKSEDNVLMVEVIKNILNISISHDDTIPNEICAICHTFLLDFLKFRDTAEKTQLFLVDLELNLEKEKTAARNERKHSIESIKSERSNAAFVDASEVNFTSSDDESFTPLKESSPKTKKSPRKKLKMSQKDMEIPKNENSEEEASNQSFSWDDENVPLIEVASRNSGGENKTTTNPRRCFQEDNVTQTDDKMLVKRERSYDSIEITIESPLDNPEECTICQKQFSKERYLRHHLRTTHKINIKANYPCNRCTRKFMQKLSWERHQKIHDDPNLNKPVSCEICGKFYINKQTLKAHIRSIHIDIGKKYVCEECGAQFKGISSLKTHKITHTGEFPFECEKCDRRFQSKANLFVHQDTHTETPYVCEICNKPSTTLRGLRLHMVNHSDEKPHKCHMCGNAYKRITALKKHLIVHSGIRPYACNFCERTFADGSNKRIHMRRLHKKELAEMESAGMKVPPAVLPKIQQLREDGGGVTVQV
ncbi:zinc finger protein ZFP2-like [Episyrphus balteatus]|uniref:zinc finger protein ZFP2-like n=1 Tax=Episyrphus balteatus TaxID=286459 RepID=UPI0024864ABC|nr:zinc finger protein ZFP2-like [Episyrphus balteatus]